ncbi:MAG: protoporphyrinogen oxidase [Salibacteraceae bacterium]|jgi:protoporphyrinogen oxidase
MKIGIIGAGISGLSVARLLCGNNDVEILEKSSETGGIAKTRMVDGVPYHMIGGHCMNLKNQVVRDFVYEVLPEDNWHSLTRVAKISFRGNLIDYPIEFSIPQIAKFDEDLAFEMTKDFLSTKERKVENLDDWFRMSFGDTIAREYMIPYNQKIWGKPLSEISPSWVEGKLPIPNKKQFFKSLFGVEKDKMPHAEFFYPNNDEPNQLIRALGVGLNISLDYEVVDLKRSGLKWIVNGDKVFDTIISTMPLNLVHNLLNDTPEIVKKSSGLLRYNSITNMLWETAGTKATWTYFPEPSTIFHRHIHIGNFLVEKSNYTITEALGNIPRDIMEREGAKIEYLKEPLDYHQSDHAYVVYDHNYDASVKAIKDYLDSLGIYTLGRFGEWEYYNMDICIESAMRLAEKISTTDRPS